VTSQRGFALLGALMAVLFVAASALAIGAEVGARWRGVARQRSGQLVRLAAELTADSVAALEGGMTCLAGVDSTSGPSLLQPGVRLERIVSRWPRSGGGCRWVVDAEVRLADGLLFAAHRAVRRSDLR
jgi:hypothetical protein